MRRVERADGEATSASRNLAHLAGRDTRMMRMICQSARARTRAGGRSVAAVLFLGFVLASPASALPGNFVYTDVIGTDVDYLGINETTNTGTEEFEQPSLAGADSLVFFPTDYTAEATGAGGSDFVASLLNVTIMAKNSTTLDVFRFTELGDSLLIGGAGSAAFGFIQLSGVLTVLEDTSGPIVPIPIGFSVVDGNVTFAPTDFLTLPANFGASTWSGVVEIDLTGLNATKLELQLDNNLLVQTFAVGETSRLQKKFGGVRLDIIPEPTTSVLVGLGLAALGLRRRRRV